MSIARPIAGRHVWWLIVAGLVVFAALSLSTSLAPLRHALVLQMQTHSLAPAVDSGSGQGMPARSVAPSTAVHSSQSSADNAAQPGSQAPPAGTTGSSGAIAPGGFADADSNVVGAAQPQDAGCGLAGCTHPK